MLRIGAKPIHIEIRNLRTSFRNVERSLQRIAEILTHHDGRMIPKGRTNGRARPRLSAKSRASLVLQGRYMGYMRQLNPRQKAQVRRIRAAEGVRVAVQKARQLTS